MQIVVTDDNKCEGTDTVLINFTQHPGINEVYSNANVNVFPNPTKGLLKVNMREFPAGDYKIDLYSYKGKVLYSLSYALNSDNETVNLDLGHLPNGLYFLKVKGEIGEVSRKVIINR